MKLFKYAFVATMVAASGVAVSATDGTLGTTSSGTSVVTIIKDNAVQISDVNDLNMGNHSALTADEVMSDGVCVFSSTGGYNVTVSSANGALELVSGTDTIPYSLDWAAGGAPAAVTLGTPIIGLAGDQSATDCGGTPNASFEVTVAQADFNSAPPGTYTDTLTLLINPE